MENLNQKNNIEMQEVTQLEESKKDLELGVSNSRQDEIIEKSSSTDTISQNDVVINSEDTIDAGGQAVGVGSFDPFAPNGNETPIEDPHSFETEDPQLEEPALIDEILIELDNEEFIDGISYPFIFSKTEVGYIPEKNMKILNLIYKHEETGVEVQDSYFINDNKYCVKNNFKRLKEVLGKYNCRLGAGKRDVETIAKVIENRLKGTRVELVQSTRHSNTGKDYKNYDVVSVLGKYDA